MVAGRPQEHNRMKIAQEMIEWAKLPDSVNLNKFCCLHDPILSPSMIIRWTKEDNEFRQSYEIAKSFLGFRREEKLTSNELHVKAYDVNAATYDLFLRDERREQAQFESDLRKKENDTNNIPPDYVEAFNKHMNQIMNAQSSACKIVDNNNKEAAKS